MKVTKLDAATSQIATAIWLYFEDSDPISVHTLVHAGCEIIDRLCDAKGTPGIRKNLLERIKPEYQKTVSDKLNLAANFFKHAATSKPDEALENFDDERNFMGLIHACHGLTLLGVKLPQAEIFSSWINVAQPELLEKPVPREEIAKLFGNVWDQPRAEQKKVGRDALALRLTGKLPAD